MGRLSTESSTPTDESPPPSDGLKFLQKIIEAIPGGYQPWMDRYISLLGIDWEGLTRRMQQGEKLDVGKKNRLARRRRR